MQRHVLLVGLPGVGKSTVGTLVAEALPAPAARHRRRSWSGRWGCRWRRSSAMVGEPRFRAMERDAVATAQAREPAVIVPGAGWAAQPGQMEAAGRRLPHHLSQVLGHHGRPPERARARSGPCWLGADPVERVRTLLAAREPFYKLAHYEVAADVKAAPAVADEVIRLATGAWGVVAGMASRGWSDG